LTAERWQQVKQLFQSTADLPADDREEYLTSQTSGDEELYREVRKMLRHSSGTGPLDRPAWEGLHIERGIDRHLDCGTQLGSYEIVREVGAGGMGQVYEARDTRIGRTVAIKVLRAEFSHRLRLEARAISALNHPHVCALYDIGEEDGIAYLVMEYVEGESLAAKLARGPLPLDAVLSYGAQIAGALAAAHAQAIVHRDLKPANIMITAAGAKVLDFGVARMAQESEEEPSADAVVGTAAYMSPSQWNGSPADARSDIFALGLVLCEMITGERPSRESPTPPSGIPDGLASLIGLCLRSDAASRVQEMEEVRSALEGLRFSPVSRARRPWLGPVSAAALLALTIGLGAAVWEFILRGAITAPPVVSVNIPAPALMAAEAPLPPIRPVAVAPPKISAPEPVRPPILSALPHYSGTQRDPSLSPDGALIAFSLSSRGSRGYRLCVQSTANPDDPDCLTDGATDDWGSAWSPSGSRIAFRRRTGATGIYWVSPDGGPVHLVAATARQSQDTMPQVSWSRDARWIAAPERHSMQSTEIDLFSVDTGEKRSLTTNPDGVDQSPAFSPDGKSLAYASCHGGTYPCDVYVVDLDRSYAPSVPRRITTEEGMYLRGLAWQPDGKGLVYAASHARSEDTRLWTIRLVPGAASERIDLAGREVRHPAVSSAGHLLAFTRLGSWSLLMIQNFR
jgi:serine/threonine protein kinase